MSVLNYRIWIVAIVAMAFNLFSPNIVTAKSSRILVTDKFKAIFSPIEDYGDSALGNVTISFYMRNVSSKDIRVVMSASQLKALTINHPATSNCYAPAISGIPALSGLTRYSKDELKRVGVFIPQGDGLFVTVKLTNCTVRGRYRGKLKDGIVSGNVIVIAGENIFSRPISGSF